MLRSFELFVAVFFLFSLCEKVDSLRKPYLTRNAYQDTEELVIENVTSYNHFELGRDVSKWKSVTVGRKNYAVGLMQTGICIFSAEMDPGGTVIFQNATSTIYQFIDVELINYWNSTTKDYQVIAVFISITFNLEWFKISDNLELEKIWTWSLHKEITHINVFKFINMHHLVVLKKHNYFTAAIYRFTLSRYGNLFWLSQTIPLEYEAKTSAFNIYNSNYFLSIPQDQEIVIFKYESNRFIPFANVSSANADALNAFNIGIRSYLLVNGRNSGIYKFNNYGVTREEIENVSLDGINFWLSMRLTTYKEEVILLAQRILDHDDHHSKKIELISSTGNDFMVYEEIPCKYYGDDLSGIDCLVEEENHGSSINGSAVLILDRMLGIVVPRKDYHSALFLLHVGTREVPNPIQKRMKKLKAIKAKLEKMVEEQRAFIKKYVSKTASEDPKIQSNGVKSSASYGESAVRTFESDFEAKIDALHHDIKEVKAKFKDAIRIDSNRIIINNLRVENIIAIKGSTTSKDLEVHRINEMRAKQLITDFVRIGDKKMIAAKKTFANLDAEKIDAKRINGNDVNSMCFKSKTVVLNELLMIEKLAEVQGSVVTTSGMINDNINISQVLSVEGSIQVLDEIEFEDVKAKTIEAKIVNKLPIHSNRIEWEDNLNSLSEEKYDKLYMPGNVIVENINGYKLQSILDSICMKNTATTISGSTLIRGNIRITNDIEVDYLNELKYPEEYAFNDDESDTNFITFSGNKIFENELTASELTSVDDICGINTSTVVTLSENQTIPGLFTFTNLDVLGGLDVNGTISGVPDVVPNPTIKETKTLKADINFKVLEIDGLLIIGNTVNGTHLEQALEDVVLKDERETIITAIKDFKRGVTVSGNAKIDSNSISGVPLDSFIDKTLKQTLNIDVLNGNVIFENLLIAGHFGGINITQLDEESVKLSGEQFISSRFNFMEDISIGDFKIKDSLNDVTLDSYIFKTSDRFLPFLSELNKVNVDQVTIEGNFKGAIGNFDIEKFDDKRLSLTKDQLITATYMVDNMYIDDLQASLINNYNYVDLTNPERYHTLLLNQILQNKIKIKNLKVLGDLRVRKIDGISMDDVIKLCPYQGGNKLQSKISFRDDVEFSKVTIENFNDIPFGTFVQNLVFKNETNVIFEGPTYFEEGFEVNKFMDTSSINEIPLENILRKTSDQEVFGPFVIKGDVSVTSDTIVAENLNGISIKSIAEIFESIGNHTFKINGDVVFAKQTYVDNLEVYGLVNDRSLPTFFKEIVYLNDDIVVPGITNFTNQVQINGNLGVMETINTIELSKFANDVVYITKDTYIQGLVSFERPIRIRDELTVESDILCESIMDIDVRDWRKNAIFISRDFIPGHLRFESVTILDSIKTNFINSINMSTVIPLRTDQYIPESLYFRELSANHEVKVGNLVNEIKLEAEFRNTLLNKGPQIVLSQIEFTNNVLVHENLETNAPVNGLNFNKIVTINTDQNLTAAYRFEEEMVSSSDLKLLGLVNEINITEWSSKGLKRRSDNVQAIESSLIIAKNLTFENNVTCSTGLISDLNFNNLANEIDGRGVFRESTERQLIDGYSKICTDVNSLLDKATSQMYKFKYFNRFQLINFDSDINIVHHFEHKNEHYMLVNEKASCKSRLYSWSESGFFMVNDGIQTGTVSQIITVRDKNNSLYLVGRSGENAAKCVIEGTNVWKFENIEELLHERNLENFRLLHESKIPGTFYGVASEFVYEFNIKSYAEPSMRILRKWKIENTANVAFMPYGLRTGLSLRDEHKILKLTKQEISPKDSYTHDHTHEEIAVEDVVEEVHHFIPGRYNNEFIVLNVSKPRIRPISATTTHEESSIKGKRDFIQIFDDILEGKLFTKIPARKPSSLLSVEFKKNGETLLVFLENEELVQVYEYKGIEGFKLRSSIKERGQQLIGMLLPFPYRNKIGNALTVIDRNKLTILEAIMDGDSIDEESLQCTLPNL